MNNERYNQIIDEVYDNYLKTFENQSLMDEYSFDSDLMIKTMFIEKIKNNIWFSERWGLKIEERELSEKERMKIAGYEDVGGIGQNIIREKVDIDDTIPRRAITLTYNNETIKVYG